MGVTEGQKSTPVRLFHLCVCHALVPCQCCANAFSVRAVNCNWLTDCRAACMYTPCTYYCLLPDPSGSHRHQQGIAVHTVAWKSRQPRESYRISRLHEMVSDTETLRYTSVVHAWDALKPKWPDWCGLAATLRQSPRIMYGSYPDIALRGLHLLPQS